MRITIDDLTVVSTHLDRRTLLDDWSWLIGKRKFPIVISAIGDAFIEDSSTGTVHWLDVGQGQIHDLSNTAEEFHARLQDHDFAMMVLQAPLIVRLHKAGVMLKPGEIYSYKIPPAVGGFYEQDNFIPTDIALHFTNAGQFHRQIKKYK